VLLIWLACAFHTAVDARRRFASASARVLWTAAGLLLPIAGPVLYLVVRPSETLVGRRQRRRRLLYLELAAREPGVEQTVATPAARPVPHRSFEAQPATR
jgi:hypothetical protein